MAFDVVRGKIADSIKQTEFVKYVNGYAEEFSDEGVLYLGYPLSANIDRIITADALVIGKKCGVAAFIFPQQSSEDLQKIYSQQDEMFTQMEIYFKKYPMLVNRRRLFFNYRVVSVIPKVDFEVEESYFIKTVAEIPQFLAEGENLSDMEYRQICEALQKLRGLNKPQDRIAPPDSLGSKLAEIESQINNLDLYQQRAAMELTDGPQRIRGLAGSGKTIVLAMRAAYLHAQFPDWNIAVTYYSRTLKEQFRNHISRFYSNFTDASPNWDKLKIMPAWGGEKEGPGIYSTTVKSLGMDPLTYNQAVSKYGRDNAFDRACAEFLPNIGENYEPVFDAVLIDEAQDFTASFFKIVYKITKNPKRITWAYDELQNIKNLAMPSAVDMFGVSESDGIDFSLQNLKDEAMRDIVLPVCYRNPKWCLAVAHSLGFGIYRKADKAGGSGIVQMFDSPEMWEDVGYQCVDGELSMEAEMTLKRRNDTTPSYFDELLSPQSCVQFRSFDTVNAQYLWVTEEIRKNITEDGLNPEDILVIFATENTQGTTKRYDQLRKIFAENGIKSVMPGYNDMDKNAFRRPGYVTCSQIYRSKGNEAPMVYIVNSQECADKSIGSRNILFTAITRSRAWVRILGVGANMDGIVEEINACVANDYRLKFKYPTPEEFKEIRTLKSDLDPNESKRRKEFRRKGNGYEYLKESIKNLLTAFDNGKITRLELGEKLKTAYQLYTLSSDSNGESSRYDNSVDSLLVSFYSGKIARRKLGIELNKLIARN